MRYVVGSLAAALAVSGGLWLKDRSEVGNLRDAMARSQVQRQFLESALAAERAERDRAVSYTHLTLPTNREV